MSMPASASFASVVIPGQSVLHIEEAAFAVFKADGFSATLGDGGNMLFQREGSRQNQLAYSGFSGEPVDIRVRAEVVDLGNGSCRLQCQAYIVQDAGDGMFEEEIRLTNLHRMPYQKLLDAVAKKLK